MWRARSGLPPTTLKRVGQLGLYVESFSTLSDSLCLPIVNDGSPVVVGPMVRELFNFEVFQDGG